MRSNLRLSGESPISFLALMSAPCSMRILTEFEWSTFIFVGTKISNFPGIIISMNSKSKRVRFWKWKLTQCSEFIFTFYCKYKRRISDIVCSVDIGAMFDEEFSDFTIFCIANESIWRILFSKRKNGSRYYLLYEAACFQRYP